MNDKTQDISSPEEFSYKNLLAVLIKPQIIITFITAIAGPWTIAEVSNDIKEREIQSQIVTKIMELSSQTNSEEDFRKKINFLTTLVGDNEFGLQFPSIQELIENERRIEREGLQTQLDNKEEELLKQKAAYEANMEELERKKEELAKAADKNLQKEIAELESKTREARATYESLGSDVKIQQEKIHGLNQQVENLMQERVQVEEQLNKRLEDKDQDIRNLEEKLEATEKDLEIAREQIEKYEIAQNKPNAKTSPVGNDLAKLDQPQSFVTENQQSTRANVNR
jgi:chromosome segregation ATPase